jgi:hypothetical protein
MSQMQLGEFTQRFLAFHGLTGFALVFEPMFARRSRRAKRSTVMVEAEKPETGNPLSSSKTVNELIERFHRLAPETRDWTIGSDRYAARLYDDINEPVAVGQQLGDVRRRDAERREAAQLRGTKAITKALLACEKILEPKEVAQLVKQILRDRYPA